MTVLSKLEFLAFERQVETTDATPEAKAAVIRGRELVAELNEKGFVSVKLN